MRVVVAEAIFFSRILSVLRHKEDWIFDVLENLK